MMTIINNSACTTGWGRLCNNDCNCESASTICNIILGCEQCLSGLTSGDCSVDINECNNSICGNNTVCTNTFGAYKCNCDPGYSATNETHCKGLHFVNIY